MKISNKISLTLALSLVFSTSINAQQQEYEAMVEASKFCSDQQCIDFEKVVMIGYAWLDKTDTTQIVTESAAIALKTPGLTKNIVKAFNTYLAKKEAYQKAAQKIHTIK
ncbi:hypothetical protein [Aliikangiella coralliicola]|uniref:Cytochrome c n=1 Tax=Aliikangiella coralliicola TaxID=2592383 RepID=A0A545UC90_9GAMM|nr:hypothetical protein [Aliikangiella coralliicola]TQV87077.1 hypothetical protein FLL46_14830 [Aliikangiella coralliicola]